ncbi:response regulator [Roseomonas sp. M0104]|uniref:histidine kinase n=1 Tax=Teichococcus coralli TaxID=2545983 RepID=A0A845B782_9PROT|nr:ATP-binding protein [Pseudoroseomonas coralli]MXP63503.1 response regulator [Pseudoroseomonas coralli]
MTGTLLLALPLQRELDVAAARQSARHIAEMLGLERRGQTRIATAVSEVARLAVQTGGGEVRFLLLDVAPAALCATIRHPPPPGASPLRPDGSLSGLEAAQRLSDTLQRDIMPDGDHQVRLAILLPPHAAPPATEEILRRLRTEQVADPLRALHEQNLELVHSLDELRQRQEEMVRLNAELEDTNRGVVALHAELDERAEALRLASELKSRFLSNMSHEFRTPLNSILALSRLLLERADGPLTSEQEKQVQLMRRSAENLLEMVDDLLDLAKVEAGKATLRPAIFSVAELLGGLRASLRPLQPNGAVELVFEDAGGLPPLQADEGKVAQILRNFVSNALKFTRAGTVRVSAALQGETMVFAVADTGIGIAPEDIERIFDEFSQVESAQLSGGGKMRHKGTGLGLPLSRRLAELLGGRVTVESRPGEGSVFRLHLPLGLSLQPEALPASADAAAPVLVVDDDESFRYVFRQWITELGYPVVEAPGGREGVDMARTLRPRAIMLDLRMPEMDGFAVLRSLAETPETRAIPVVIATSSVIDAELRVRLPEGAVLLPKESLGRDAIAQVLRRILPGGVEGVRA